MHAIFTDALGQKIQVGHTVLYAGYHSNRLRQATVITLRQREGRPELLVKLHNDRGSVSILHHPRRTVVLRDDPQRYREFHPEIALAHRELHAAWTQQIEMCERMLTTNHGEVK